VQDSILGFQTAFYLLRLAFILTCFLRVLCDLCGECPLFFLLCDLCALCGETFLRIPLCGLW
jgi:hypothetical protein